MYVITGITGKVGGALARNLIKAGHPVRAVMRDAGKAAYWADQGCDVVFAQMDDAPALTEAFKGATGVFILPPPGFDPQPGFPEARAVIAAVSQALQAHDASLRGEFRTDNLAIIIPFWPLLPFS